MAHDVTNIGLIVGCWLRWPSKAKVIQRPPRSMLSAVADQGYTAVKKSGRDEAGIVTYVAKTDTSGKRTKGEF